MSTSSKKLNTSAMSNLLNGLTGKTEEEKPSLSPTTPPSTPPPARKEKMKNGEEGQFYARIHPDLLRRARVIAVMENVTFRYILEKALGTFVHEWERKNGEIKAPSPL